MYEKLKSNHLKSDTQGLTQMLQHIAYRDQSFFKSPI